MKTLLRIDASTRINGSITRVLTDYFQTQWFSRHPDHKVIYRCLASNPIPHITHETINAFHHADEPSSDSTLSDTLIEELSRADHLLIGSPLYNLTDAGFAIDYQWQAGDDPSPIGKAKIVFIVAKKAE